MERACLKDGGTAVKKAPALAEFGRRLYIWYKMYTLRVESDFAAAHFLSRYRGKCENLHGHNYRVRLWVRGEALDGGGMLADFGALKNILRGICGTLDHGNLNDLPVFENDPSAERIARYIYGEAERRFPGEGLDPALLDAVEVYETPLTMARYEKRE